MTKVPGTWKLSRSECFKKSLTETLLSNSEKLLILSTKFKKHGERIVQPQHRFEDINAVISDGATEEFKDVLNSIQEVLVLPLSLSFALNPYYGVWEYIRLYDDPLDVEELSESDYDILRRELLKPKHRGGVVARHGVVLQSDKGHSVKKLPKAPPPVTFTKRYKQ
ncbi:sucrose synthase [Ranunculus cassubicifolius]